MTTVTRGAFIIRYLCTTTKNGSHSCWLYEEYVNSLRVTISKYVISFPPVTREKWVNIFRNSDKKWVCDNPAADSHNKSFILYRKKSEFWYDLYWISFYGVFLIHVIIGLDYDLPLRRWQPIIPVISWHSLDIFQDFSGMIYKVMTDSWYILGFLRHDIQSDDWHIRYLLFTRTVVASLWRKVFDTFYYYEMWELTP